MASEEEKRADYMERHGVADIFEELGVALVLHKPEDPLAFLADQLEKMSVAHKRGADTVALLSTEELGARLAHRPSLYKRDMIATAASASGGGSGATFKLMQFNTLADALATTGGFVVAPERSTEWHFRKLRLLQQLRVSDADLLTLQEVDHYDDLVQPGMAAAGYDSLFKQKPRSPCLKVGGSKSDGVVLLWRSARFSLLESREMNFHAAGEPDTATNQVAIIARLADAETGKHLLVAATHLKAGSLNPELEPLRVAQTEQLMAALADMKNADTAGIVIGADMNAEPDGDAVRTVKEHELGMSSAYADAEGVEPAWTTWKIRSKVSKHTIDYIFHDAGVTPTAVLAIPDDDIVGENGLPNFSHISDHISLMAEFAYSG